jgi:hypothetical protein
MHAVQGFEGFGSSKRWGGCPTGNSGQCTHLHTSDGALPVFEHGGSVPDQHVEEEPWPLPTTIVSDFSKSSPPGTE